MWAASNFIQEVNNNSNTWKIILIYESMTVELPKDSCGYIATVCSQSLNGSPAFANSGVAEHSLFHKAEGVRSILQMSILAYPPGHSFSLIEGGVRI